LLGKKVVIADAQTAISVNEIGHYLRRAQGVIIPVLPFPIDIRAAMSLIQKVFAKGRVIRKKCQAPVIAN
jgi:hypothetical protein